MSGAAFAEQMGIKYQTFATWAQEKKRRAKSEQKAPGENQPVQWVEAVVEARGDAEARGTGLQIRLGGGELMEIADQQGAILAAAVLRHLRETR